MQVDITYNYEIGNTMPNYVKLPLSILTAKHPKITELEYLVEVIPSLSETGPWIAGGSLLRTKMGLLMNTDIDIFFKNEKQYLDYEIKIKNDVGNKFEYISQEKNNYAHTIYIKYMGKKYKLQLIVFKYYESPCDMLDNFDLDICQIAYDGDRLYVAENTFKSIDNLDMHINHVNNPAYVMSRCMKYARLGFKMSNSEINKFFSLASKSNVQNSADKQFKNESEEEYAALAG